MIFTSANIKFFSDVEHIFKLSLLLTLEDNGSHVCIRRELIPFILLTTVPDRFNIKLSLDFSLCESFIFSLLSGCIGGLLVIRSLYK